MMKTLDEVSLKRMSWYDVKLAIDKGCDTLILPFASVEQHGPHLPLLTDSLVVDWIAEQAAMRSEGVLVAPPVYYGVSGNHIKFEGTGSVSADNFINYLADIGVTELNHGFKRLIMLNGHGGNNAPSAIAAQKVRERTGKFVGVIMWLTLCREAEDRVLTSEIKWHADEAETSLVLHIDPSVVKMERAVKADPKPIPYYVFTHEALFNNPVDQGLPMTQDITDCGIVGDATLATPEKGEAILEQTVDNLVKIIAGLRKQG